MKGILGHKVGMTQVFTKSGLLIPVTVVSVEPNIVTQIKTKETDGYEAIQLGFATKKEKLTNKPEQGHVKKANTKPKRFFREIRGININDYSLGQELKIDIFKEGDIVDVSGISKGKGFQGVIKRYGFTRGPMGHGSHHHRSTGSIGTKREKRVQLGHKMPGHMGYEQVTIQNLEIIAIDLDNNVILIKGNIPGPKKSLVMIKTAIKENVKKSQAKELLVYDQSDTTIVANQEEIPEIVEEELEEVKEVPETVEEVEEIIEEPEAPITESPISDSEEIEPIPNQD